MSSDERVYTRMSGMAVKGLQRIVRDRSIYVRESATERGGYTVVTKGALGKTKSGWAAKRKLERLSA